MQYLRYNTDSQEVVFGIFVDSTDGNTEETGLTIANTDIKIWKSGATTLANKNSGGATHISNGIYYAVFNSTDTNTLGSGKAFVHVSGALYQVLEFCVLPQKVYDSMIAGSDNLEVDAIQIEGTDATDQINSACDTAISDAGVTTTRMGYVDYLANATYGLSAIETLVDEIESRLTATRAGYLDELGSANIPADIDTLLSRLTALRAGYIDNLSGGAVALASGVTVSDKTGFSLSSAGVSAVQSGLSTLTAQQVWEYATRTLSSFGTLVSDIISGVWGATTRTLSAFGFNVTASSVTDKTGYSLSESGITAVQSGLSTFNPSSDTVAHVTLVDTCTENTDMRGTDGANTTTPDNASITAIKTKTDQFAFTVANKVDATATIEGGDATAANQTTIINHLIGIKGSTFSEGTDSLEAIRDRGDAAWTTGGGASGSNAITITVTDTDDVNIIDAAVEIWDSAGVSFIERKSSNSSGQTVFNLDDGTYTVKIHKSGNTIENQTLIVSGAASVTYEMTAFVIGTPASASLCRVYDYFHELDDGTLSRLTGTATIQTPYQDSNGYYYSEENGIYNSSTGVLYFDLVIGSSVIIDIPDMGISKTVTVPNSATARLKDL